MNNKYKLGALIIAMTLIVSGCSLDIAKQSKPIANNQGTDNNKAGNNAKVLDLSNKNLEKLDMSIFDSKGLEELNVSNNRLSGSLPSQIGNLQDLKVLNASNNNFTGVPAEIGHLPKLEILDLSNNQLTGLPNELGNLKNIKTINLSGNNYSEADLKIIKDKLPNTEFILN